MENSLQALQKVELEMLKDIASFCDEKRIQYFIIAGTLLGAVRDGGFIPWDDDIDIGMDLKNYKKFLKYSKKFLPEKYHIQHFSTEPRCSNPWIKVRINGTTSMERDLVSYDIHQGVCMDVFLFNGISDRKIKRFIQKRLSRYQHKLLKKYYSIAKQGQHKPKTKTDYIPEFLRRALISLFDRIINIDYNKTKFCYNTFFSDVGSSYKYESNWFKNPKQLEFEGKYYFAPREYEKYLTARYGDWKTPPPVKERTGHGNIIIDLYNDYTKYQR